MYQMNKCFSPICYLKKLQNWYYYTSSEILYKLQLYYYYYFYYLLFIQLSQLVAARQREPYRHAGGTNFINLFAHYRPLMSL